MNKEFLKKAATAGLKLAGAIVSVVGFFSDFVKPFMNLTPIFLFLSLFAAAGIWWFVFSKKLRHSSAEEIFKSSYGKAFGIALISTGFWILMVPLFALTPEKGVAATVSPGIGSFQEQLFGRLDVIENKIDQGFEKVLDRLDSIDANAGLVSDPKTAEDFFYNARIHELRGNLIEAKKSYEKFFESNLNYLDPYLSYILILKNLEGPSSAREIMSKQRDEHFENPSVQLAYILLKEEREDRIALLKDLIEQHPDYGPAYFYLGEQYSFKESGDITNATRLSERENFEKLLELEKDQKLSKYFLDKKLADEKIAFAEDELTQLEGMTGAMLDNPVQVEVDYLNKAASLTFILTENVQKIFYRLDEQGEFKDTGSMGVSMPGMSTPLPNYQVVEPMTLGDHVVEVKYVDMNGKESPVYRHEFSLEALVIQSNPHKMINAESGQAEYMIFWSVLDESKGYDFYYSVDDKSLGNLVDNGITLTGLSPGKHIIYMQGVAGSEKTNLAEMTFEVF